MPVDYSKMKVTELKTALKAKVMNDLPIMFSMLQKFLLLVRRETVL